MNRASKEWMDQFKVGGGSVAITCSCTRTHVAIESHDFEDGERARYEAAAKNNPKAYVLHHGVDSVSEHTINGLTIVDECECGTMARFEQFVIREREFILGYYKAVADKAAKNAAEINQGLASIATSQPEATAMADSIHQVRRVPKVIVYLIGLLMVWCFIRAALIAWRRWVRTVPQEGDTLVVAYSCRVLTPSDGKWRLPRIVNEVPHG